MVRLSRLVAGVVGVCACAGAARAQLVPVDGRPVIPVTAQRVEAFVEDGLARTTLRQVFLNPHEQVLEAIYTFRLPEGASIVDLAMDVGGQRLEGLLAERQRARRVYDSIVRAKRDPALVEQIGADRFRLSVFPVVPHAETVVELSWIEHLPLERGAFRYTCPLAGGDAAPPRDLMVAVTLRSAVHFGDVEASRPDVQVVRRSAHEVHLSLEAVQAQPSRDLEVRAAVETPEADLSVRTFRDAAGRGWFLALVTPPPDAKDALVPRDVVLVIDTSGSMSSEGKLERAQRSALWLLRNLRAADRVNVVRFSSDVEAFAAGPVAPTPENLERLEDFVQGFEAVGSTALGDALAAALAGDPAPGRARTVVLLTDGRPTMGETQPAKLVALAAEAGDQRLYPFGVGSDVDAGLLRGLAAAGRGRAELFLPGAEIEARLTRFLERTSSVVMTDLELAVDGVTVHDVLPRPLPDVYLGEQLAITGRYREGGEGRIALRGRLGRGRLALASTLVLPREPGGEASVMQLHARQKLAFLEDAHRLRKGLGDDAYYSALDRGAYSTADEIVAEMIAVSLESGVQCAYTSFLVLLPEDRARLDPRDLAAVTEASRRARRLVRGDPEEEPEEIAEEEPFEEPVLADAEDRDSNEEESVEGDPDFLTDSPFDDRAFNDVIGVGGGAGGKYGGRFERKSGALRAAGGSGTEEPLRDALAWLVGRQGADGSWGGAVGDTGLALLALLGDGHTTRTGLHREAVVAAVKWLREQQDFESGRFGAADLHDHAVATLALVEAYHFSKSPLIRGTAQKAVNHLLREPGAGVVDDAGALGWSLVALQAAREAGLPQDWTVERRALERLEALASGGVLPAEVVRAACLLVRRVVSPGEELARGWSALLLGLDPRALDPELLLWASQAAFQLGGPTWRDWNLALKPALVEAQRREGEARGSWGAGAGAVRATALGALGLEVYFRRGRGGE